MRKSRRGWWFPELVLRLDWNDERAQLGVTDASATSPLLEIFVQTLHSSCRNVECMTFSPLSENPLVVPTPSEMHDSIFADEIDERVALAFLVFKRTRQVYEIIRPIVSPFGKLFQETLLSHCRGNIPNHQGRHALFFEGVRQPGGLQLRCLTFGTGDGADSDAGISAGSSAGRTVFIAVSTVRAAFGRRALNALLRRRPAFFPPVMVAL